MEQKGKFVFYCPSSERKRRSRDEYEAASSEMHSLWKKNKSLCEKNKVKRRRYNDDDASIKRGRRIREVIEIPNNDLLEEIMLNLPVKTLIRFQIVSKQWKRMITSKYFSERYLLHAKTKGRPKFLSVKEDKTKSKPTIALNTVRFGWSSTCLVEEENYNFSDDEEDDRVISNSLDGLFCVHGSSIGYSIDSSVDSSRQIKVVNPTTRCSYKIPLALVQRRCFPGKKYNFHPLGFGKDYVTGTYKLVWLHSIFKITLSCEVFDFGVKQWREVKPPPLLDYHGLETELLPTFVNGWMYWLHQDKTKLIAFDFHMEVFKVIPNPIIDASSSSSIYKEIRIDSTDGHHFVWLSLSTYGDDDRMQRVWKLTNHNTGGELSIVNKVFSFNYYNITYRSDFVVPKLFQIQPISKNGNKFLLSGGISDHFFLVQPLNSTPFEHPLLPTDFPFHPDETTLIPFFPSLISPF